MIYIAMLRGINVSGHKIIKMEQLGASFAALGFSNVKTYLQSGNVIFETVNTSELRLSATIAEKIFDDFGFIVPVFLRTSKDMGEIIKRNPFVGAPSIDASKLHVTFLSEDAPSATLEQLRPLVSKTEKFRVSGREIYIYCPDGYGRTRLSNTTIERKLSVGATTRNWKTTSALLMMSQ